MNRRGLLKLLAVTAPATLVADQLSFLVRQPTSIIMPGSGLLTEPKDINKVSFYDNLGNARTFPPMERGWFIDNGTEVGDILRVSGFSNDETNGMYKITSIACDTGAVGVERCGI